ncbi:MAG: protein kinase [bacterium]|nr:protein kinase [bacterium]
MTEESREIQIFLSAIEKSDPVELDAYLDKACGEDQGLREHVECLIAAHRNEHSFLERSPQVLQDAQVNATAMDAGLAATFGADAAVVLGLEGHSVLKSLTEKMGRRPTVTLRESQDERERVVQPSSAELPANEPDSRYHLMGEIARGGMGAIIRGRDTDLGRDLAIKVLLDSYRDHPEMIQRFVEEAQIGGQLQHPGIVPVYELGQLADERPFFSMKLVKGETLAALLAKRKRPNEDWPKFLGIFEQVCQTMAYAHSKGVIHRDLKPANIMVGAFGEVQVMDWGLSKVLAAGGVADEQKSLDKHRDVSVIQTRRSGGSSGPGSVGSDTRLGSRMGTPAYMPPEQALGEVDRMDERADVFGLGAILAEILTGKPAYVGEDTHETSRMASRGKLDACYARLDASGAEADLVALAKSALQAEPEDRPQDAGQMAKAITEHFESVQERLKRSELQRVEAETRSVEERRRKKLYLAIAGLAVAAIGSVAIGAWRSAAHQKELAQAAQERADAQKQLSDERVQRERVETENRLNAEHGKQMRNLAHITRLTAIAQDIEQTLPVQSVLVATEAVKLAKAANLWPVPHLHETLARSVSNLGGKPLLSDHSRIGRFQETPDGGIVVYAHTKPVYIPSLQKDFPEVEPIGDEPLAGSISEDGSLAVRSEERRIHAYQFESGSREFSSVLRLDGEADTCVVSPNGRWVVGSDQGNYRDDSSQAVTRLWDLQAEDPQTEVASWESGARFVEQYVFSRDGRWLVERTKERMQLWDLSSTEPRRVLQTPSGSRNLDCFSDDSRWLFSSRDTGTELFDLTEEDVTASVITLSDQGRRAAAFSHDSQLLATSDDGSGEKAVWIFDLTAADPAVPVLLLRESAPSGGTFALAFSPDRGYLVAGYGNRTARIWYLDSIQRERLPLIQQPGSPACPVWDAGDFLMGDTRLLRGHEERVNALHISQDGRHLLTGSWDGSLRWWDLDSENPGSETVLRGHRRAILDVEVSSDGRWLVTGGSDHSARLWDLTALDPAASSMVLQGPEDNVSRVTFSPDSRWLYTGSGHIGGAPFKPVSKVGLLWDLTADNIEKSVRVLRGHTEPFAWAVFSPDSRKIATVSYDTTARVWNLANPAEDAMVLTGHNEHIPSFAFSSDSRTLLTGDTAGTLRAWDLDSGTHHEKSSLEPRILLQQDDWIMGIGLETGHETVLTGAWNRATRVWAFDRGFNLPATPRLLKEAQAGAGLINPFCAVFRGHLLALRAGYSSQVWDLDRLGKPPVPRFEQPADASVSAVDLSNDGRWFASCGEDGTVRVTDLTTADPTEETSTFRGHEGQVTALDFSPDGKWLVSVSLDRTARIWDLDIERLLERAQRLAGRELTEEERRNYRIPELPQGERMVSADFSL